MKRRARPSPALLLAALAAALALLPQAVSAQRRGDDRPYESWQGNRFDGRSGQGRNIAGQFDYYALVMSWSPTHCASDAGERDDQQCRPRSGRGFAFVLHGLWPQYERGYPESCPTRDRPFVPERVIDAIADVMPSRGLAIHEFRKHGTCSGLDAAGYFDLSRKLFKQIRIPDRYVGPAEPIQVAPGELVDDFVAANPDLKPEMIAVSCGGPGNRLKEIRICFTRAGKLRSCGGNENQRRLCSARQVYLPPVRGAARTAPQQRRDPGQGSQPKGSRDFLPGPRGI